jgi:hypothetical protein
MHQKKIYLHGNENSILQSCELNLFFFVKTNMKPNKMNASGVHN